MLKGHFTYTQTFIIIYANDAQRRLRYMHEQGRGRDPLVQNLEARNVDLPQPKSLCWQPHWLRSYVWQRNLESLQHTLRRPFCCLFVSKLQGRPQLPRLTSCKLWVFEEAGSLLTSRKPTPFVFKDGVGFNHIWWVNA
jgi:hypothetical protein